MDRNRDILIHKITRKTHYNGLWLVGFDCEFIASEFIEPSYPYVFFKVSILYDPKIKKAVKMEIYDEIPAANEDEFSEYFEKIIQIMSFPFTFEFNEKVYEDSYGLGASV